MEAGPGNELQADHDISADLFQARGFGEDDHPSSVPLGSAPSFLSIVAATLSCTTPEIATLIACNLVISSNCNQEVS
jgi:hypothetical protein